MKTSIGLLVLALILNLVGCGDSQDKNQGKAEAPAKSATDGTYLGAMVKAQQSAIKTVDLAGLNSAIQMFQAQEGRNPNSLDELVEMKIIPQLPAPPKGMKFAYDAKAGTVKVVAQ